MTPIVLAHEQPFRIGDADVRPAMREIALNGEIGIVEPRVMQMLVALRRADGGVISKDDLIRLCWDGRIVGEDAINRVVSRLRHDAEQKAGGAFRVETISKVGYRLVTDGSKALSIPPTQISRRRLVVGGTAAAAAAGVGALGWYAFREPTLSGEAATLVVDARSGLLDPTPDRLTNSIAKLRTASQLAPNSSEVLGLLALAYQRQARGSPSEQRRLLATRAEEAAGRALAIDPDNGDALTARTLARPAYGNWLENEQVARSALERAPMHAETNAALGFLFSEVGRIREALTFYDRAFRIEPRAVYLHMSRTYTLWDLGRLDEAETAAENAFRLWPRNLGIWFTRLYFFANNGRAHEAIAMIDDVASRPTGIPDWNFALTRLQLQALSTRDPLLIDSAVTKWREAARTGSGFAENAILFAGSLGKLDAAFEVADGYYHDRGFQIGERRWTKEQAIYTARPERHTFILFRRQMGLFRRDERFAALVREIGLGDYWRKSGTKPDYLA